MSTKEELNKFYTVEDPWGYQTHPSDHQRKGHIIAALNTFKPFNTALDIGCGEGWITKDIPATTIYGYDLSTVALSRLPGTVRPVYDLSTFNEPCDLVVITGLLYQHYDYQPILEAIERIATGAILTCHIKEWELPEVQQLGLPLFETQFPYRDYTQQLRIMYVPTA